MSERFASRRQARGEVHPGLAVVGVVLALGLAWWLARPGTIGETRSATDLPPNGVQLAGDTPVKPQASASAQESEGARKPLYRWTDAAGVVHFTDVPPNDRPYVEADVHPDRNVVQTPAAPAGPEP